MKEKVEIFEDAVIKKIKAMNKEYTEIVQPEYNKKYLNLSNQKTQLDEELKNPKLEKYIREEYENDLYKLNEEMVKVTNERNEKAQEVIDAEKKGYKDIEEYKTLSSQKEEIESEIETVNKDLARLTEYKKQYDDELKKPGLEGYIRQEIDSDVSKINQELGELNSKSSELSEKLQNTIDGINQLEIDYDVEQYIIEQENGEEQAHTEIQEEQETQEKREEPENVENNTKNRTKENPVTDENKSEDLMKKIKNKSNELDAIINELKVPNNEDLEDSRATNSTENKASETVTPTPITKEPEIDLNDAGFKITIGVHGVKVHTKKGSHDKLDLSFGDIKFADWTNDDIRNFLKDTSLTDEQIEDSVDKNLMIGLKNTFIECDVAMEYRDEIIDRYVSAIKNGRVEPNKSLKDIVKYDRKGLDFFKFSNLFNKVFHRKDLSNVKKHADMAKNMGLANVKEDTPGNLRKLIDKVKNKALLLGEGKNKELKPRKKLTPRMVKNRYKDSSDNKLRTLIASKANKIKNGFKESLYNKKASRESNKKHENPTVEESEISKEEEKSR